MEQQMLFIENMNLMKLVSLHKKSLMENFIFCAVFVQYSRYFYPHGISSPENTPRPGILTHLGH